MLDPDLRAIPRNLSHLFAGNPRQVASEAPARQTRPAHTVHRCDRAAHHSLNPSTAARPNPGLGELADRHVSVAGGAGVAAGAKVSALIAGMVAGAASIADMGLAPDPLHGQRAEPSHELTRELQALVRRLIRGVWK